MSDESEDGDFVDSDFEDSGDDEDSKDGDDGEVYIAREPTELERKNQKRWAGIPKHYEWMSPVGTFRIDFMSSKSEGKQWQLSIREDTKRGATNRMGEMLRNYPEPIDAMLDVYNQKTGYLPWDSYQSSEKAPQSDKDWHSYL